MSNEFLAAGTGAVPETIATPFNKTRDFIDENAVEEAVKAHAAAGNYTQPLSNQEFKEAIGDLTNKAEHIVSRDTECTNSKAALSTLLNYAEDGVESADTRLSANDNQSVPLELEDMLEHASVLLSAASETDRATAQSLHDSLQKAINSGEAPSNLDDLGFIGVVL